MPDLTRDELAATLTIAGTEFILFPLPAPPDWDGGEGQPEAIRPPVPRDAGRDPDRVRPGALMTEITITVHGTPAPQGSKRAFAVRGKGGVPTGRVAVIESSHDRVKSWRQAVIDAAEAAHACQFLRGPLELTVTFCLTRPNSHYRTGRNAHLLRESAPPHPAKPPDLSKLVRATEDALTACGLWADDAQVVICSAVKQWCRRDQAPGAFITIREVWEQEP